MSGGKKGNKPKQKSPMKVAAAGSMPPTTSPPQQSPKATSISHCARLLKWPPMIASGVLAVSGILPLFQIPSVEPPASIDLTQPFSAPFIVRNASLLPIWGMKFTFAPEVDFYEGGGFSRIIWAERNLGSDFLSPGKETTARCDRLTTITNGGGHVKAARVTFGIRYHYALWPWSLHDQYVFSAVIDKDQHVSRWLPE
jgi:hypothetical protein